MKEVFIPNILKYKNLSQFIQIHHEVGEIDDSTCTTKLLKVIERKSLLSSFSSSLQDQFLATRKCILELWRRFLFIKYLDTINYLTFLTSVPSWEIQGFLWSHIFRNQNFLVLHMLFKDSFWAVGEVFQNKKRGFCSRQIGIQKPPLVFQNKLWVII